MKLSLALMLSSAAIAMALSQQGGDEGDASGSAPAMREAQLERKSGGQSSPSREQGDLKPGYNSLGLDKLILNPVADAIGSLVPTPSSSSSPSASPSASASAKPAPSPSAAA
ncbi:uncharacterized protein BDW47DRAFT_128063 [Aspergillus candidus]|uniref:Uncharacterized protein n=1 Tax=Aspergillus candidus TaxID=41067 RepID=A0A2I2F4I9_ASPCN|nr:hypothetical protein BDW47DRAFT_128063 [Aspergillus candidus]PLB35541.1 hypothetical protein BDW47DRAFT_128063 [Aspergillus candidus]